MSKELNVKLSRTISASQKSCYEAWLMPETLKAFMSNCNGIGVIDAKIDAKVGGKFLIVMLAGNKEIPHTGVYRTLQPYKQLAFTWMSVHQTLAESLVTMNSKH